MSFCFFFFSVDTISCTCNFIKIFSGLVDTTNWTGEHRAFTVETFKHLSKQTNL